MWLLERIERHDEPPSKATVGASVMAVAGVMLLLLALVLPPAFAPWLQLTGIASAMIGGVTLAAHPGRYQRLLEEAARRGLPGLHLATARWVTNGDGCVESWRDLALTKLRWSQYCDHYPMTIDDHERLAASLHRCAQRRHPGSLRLSPTQSAYLQSVRAWLSASSETPKPAP